MSFLDFKYTAHLRDNITERGLRFPQPSSDLDLNSGKYGYGLPYHFVRDLHLCPAAKVGPSFGRSMEWTGLMDHHGFAIPAQDLTSPTHAGIDAEQSLGRRQGCQDFSDAFGFFHV